MACKAHNGGWHKTLIITQRIDDEQRVIVHTCSCWLPSDLANEGKILIDPKTPNALGIWLWKDGERKWLQ